MAPLLSGAPRRKSSIVEVADWWGNVDWFGAGTRRSDTRRRKLSEEDSLLVESMAQSDEEGGHAESRDDVGYHHESTDNILMTEEPPSKIKWLLIPLNILFPSKILVKFLLANIIPALSQLIPLFYTGKLPQQSSLSLAGQFQFVSVVLEVCQEGVGNSLFNFVGKNYKDKRSEAVAGLKLAMTLLFSAGTLLTLVTLVFTKEFVSFIDTPPDIVEKTKVFLWISSFSFPMILLNYALTNFLYITTSGHIIVVQTIQLVSTFLFNYFLFRQGSWSLNWDVDQLGTYKVIQTSFDLLVNLFFIHVIEGLQIKSFWWDISIRKDFHTKFTDLLAVSWPNFGDSAIRNFFYFIVTLKFINSLGSTEIGAWNMLMSIIFSVFLIPTNAISNYVKVLVGHEADGKFLKQVIVRMFKEALACNTAWTAILVVIGYLGWPLIASYANPTNPAVQEMSAVMFYRVGWAFVLLSYNNVLDSLFYGTGDTIYVFYQSLITNLSVYLVPWVLFEVGVVAASFVLVSTLWCSGLVVDLGLTTWFCFLLWRKIPNLE